MNESKLPPPYSIRDEEQRDSMPTEDEIRAEMEKQTLPPPRAESERQLACVSCGAVKGEGKCSNGCVFPEPSKGEQGQPPSTVQVTFCGKCGQTGLHNTRCSKCGNRLMFSDEITYARIRSGVTQQSVESVWDEAIGIVEDLVCAPQFDGNWRNGYSHAQNDAFRALELAKAESLAAQNKRIGVSENAETRFREGGQNLSAAS